MDLASGEDIPIEERNGSELLEVGGKRVGADVHAFNPVFDVTPADLIDVIVTERPREGWSVVNEQGETVALDLELTQELVRAGLVREVIRLVQEQRKSSGLEVSDRIALTWAAEGELAEALREASGLVADEVLATSLTEGEPSGDVATDEGLGLRFVLKKA